MCFLVGLVYVLSLIFTLSLLLSLLLFLLYFSYHRQLRKCRGEDEVRVIELSAGKRNMRWTSEKIAVVQELEK